MSVGLDFEEKVLRRFELIEKRKAMKEQIDLLEEEIAEHFRMSSEGGRLVFPLPDGTFALIESVGYVKDVFDRAQLAAEVLIPKSELQKPFDISLLTEKGKLTPALISKHTRTETEIRVKIKKRKTKPKGVNL